MFKSSISYLFYLQVLLRVMLKSTIIILGLFLLVVLSVLSPVSGSFFTSIFWSVHIFIGHLLPLHILWLWAGETHHFLRDFYKQFYVKDTNFIVYMCCDKFLPFLALKNIVSLFCYLWSYKIFIQFWYSQTYDLFAGGGEASEHHVMFRKAIFIPWLECATEFSNHCLFHI